MAFEALKYTKGVVIVHGKSELALVRYIHTNLHLPIRTISRKGGKTSIQINGLREFLNKKQFCSLSAFANEYSVEYDKRNKKLIDFKLFIIMDVDDCDENMQKQYRYKKLFDGHPLKGYIVPIYNIRNLEEVLLKAGIMTEKIPDSKKGTYYNKIFPINTKPMSVDTVNQIRFFAAKLKGIEQSNMLEFVEYCFGLISEELWKEKDENGVVKNHIMSKAYD